VRYLTLNETLELHRRVIAQSGGAPGVLDLGALESALAQPQMTFGGNDLYPTVVEKAAALGYSLIQNHPFVDGNKRVGHAAIEVFAILNGFEIIAPVDEQEQTILNAAAGKLTQSDLTAWVRDHLVMRN
jgi:death-on-curing protein